jgi:hypothetical protein
MGAPAVTLLLEPPSDGQISIIRQMCLERGLQPPDAIASSLEGRIIFAEIKRGTYDPERYAVPFDAWPPQSSHETVRRIEEQADIELERRSREYDPEPKGRDCGR